MKDKNKLFGIIVLLLSFSSLPACAQGIQRLDFWLNPLSSEAFSFSCIQGDVLRVEFVISLDGEYYNGDQQKYDLWVGWGNGVDFYILNQTLYEHWIENEVLTSQYSNYDVTSLVWNMTIPYDGIWYIIFDNDSSVYGKQVEGSIIHEQVINSVNIIVITGVISVTCFVLLYYVLKKKRLVL